MKSTIKKIGKITLTTFLGSVILLSSCKKDKTPEIALQTETVGVYVLSEGSMGMNNSEITYYNILTGVTEKNYYKKVNGTDLGESANDLQSYGSKMYCVISGSQGSEQSFLDILDIKTAQSIKRISLNKDNEGYIPRNIVFDKNKAYISCLDGKVLRLDTATYTIDELEVGAGLEQLAIASNKLYVTHSDHYLYPDGKKKAVSVIDLNTFTVKGEIEVGNNPKGIAATKSGDLFVFSSGSYDANWNFNNDAAVARINSSTDTKTATYTYFDGNAIESKAIYGDYAYVATNTSLKKLNIADGSLGNDFITDATATSLIYGLTINPLNNDLYVADAINYSASEGKVFCFGTDGKKKFEFAAAQLPKTAVFYNALR